MWKKKKQISDNRESEIRKRKLPGYKEKIQVISRKKAAENTLDLYGLVIFVLTSSIGEIIYGLTCMLVVLIQDMSFWTVFYI